MRSTYERAAASMNFFSDALELYLRRFDRATNPTHPIIGLTYGGEVLYTPGAVMEPVYISRNAAQELADTLWQAGIRPTQAAATDGEITALKAHRDHEAILIDRLLRSVLKEK